MLTRPPWNLLLSGRPFTPASIPGLKLWLKSDTGLWQNTAGTTPATLDADPIGRWDDQSGLGNHVLQVTAGHRPTLKLAIQSGRPVIRLDGVDDSLAVAFALPDPAYIVLVVAQRTWTANKNLIDSGSAGLRQLYQETTTPRLTMFESANGPSTAALALSTFGVLETFWNGSASFMSLNGADNTGNPGTSASADGITLGATRGGGSNFSAIDVAEVVASGAPSAENRSAMRAYLKQRWGTP